MTPPVDSDVAARELVTNVAHPRFSESDSPELVALEGSVASVSTQRTGWMISDLEARARTRGVTPQERVLAIFDVFDEWFHREDFAQRQLGPATGDDRLSIRRLIDEITFEAGMKDQKDLALSLLILLKGAVLSAVEGDRDAALRAKGMARALLAAHRGTIATTEPSGALDLDLYDQHEDALPVQHADFAHEGYDEGYPEL
jgi:hypothetical protein